MGEEREGDFSQLFYVVICIPRGGGGGGRFPGCGMRLYKSVSSLQPPAPAPVEVPGEALALPGPALHPSLPAHKVICCGTSSKPHRFRWRGLASWL